MQVPYEIDSISEYHRKVKEGSWEFPSYKDKKCVICKRENCAVKDGHYERPAYDEKYIFIPDLQMQRYLCKTTKTKKGKLATFSLLPKQLYPYRKYSLSIATYCLSMWGKFKQNISKTVENIFSGKDVDESLLEIGQSHIYLLIEDFKLALTKYRIWKSRSTKYTLEEFIKDCSLNTYTATEVLSMEYYEGNGGYIKNSQFLFGTASQFRGG